MKQHVKAFRSLRRYLIFLSAVVSIISMAIIILFFSNEVEEYVIEQKQNYAEESLTRSSFILERELNKVTNLVNKIQNSETIISSINDLSSPEASPSDKYQMSLKLNDFLFNLSQESFLIKNILIITPTAQYSATGATAGYEFNGLEITSDTDAYALYSIPSFLMDTVSNGRTLQEILNRNNTYLRDDYFFAANIRDSNKQQKGLILVVIDEQEFANQLLAREHFQIIFDQHEVFFEGDQFDQTDKRNLLTEEIYPYNLELIYQMNVEAMTNTGFYIGFFIISITAVLGLSFLFSERTADATLQPINELLDWMNRRNATEKKFNIKPKKNNRPQSFRERLTSYFIMTIVVPVVAISVFYSWHAYRVASEEMTVLHASEQRGKTLILNQEVKQFKKILATFSSTFGVTSQGSLNRIEEAALDEFKTAYLDTFSHESIGVYDADGNLVVSSGSFIFDTVEKEMLMNRENRQSRFSYSIGLTNRGEAFMSMMLPIAHQNKFDQPLGYVVLNVSEKYFGSIPLISGDNVEFITDNDLFIWNLNEQTLSLLNEANKPDLLNGTSIKSNIAFGDWEYGSQLNQESLRNAILNIFFRNSYLYFILILILLATTKILTRKVMQPFNDLVVSFQNEPEKWSSKLLSEKIIGIDEVEQLRLNFSEGIERLNDLVNEKQELQEHYLTEQYNKREIQLFALQNQVNPHFLYNALENLLYLVEAEETDRALAMISSLSRFFQYVTNRKDLLIPLSQEIAFTKNYLQIMRERFSNFQVSWEVDEQVLDEQVMKLILQPLVENVFHHGVRLTTAEVLITIKIQKVADKLSFEVRDNGVGIPAAKLQEIRADLEQSSYNKSGLYNVKDRINLYYGDQGHFMIDSVVNQGTTVKISIPINKKPQ